MKTTLIIEVNSHPCNEYVIKNYSIKVCEMQTVSRPERFGCAHFGEKINKNLT